MTVLKIVTVVGILFFSGCMRRSPDNFEQQVREAGPQVSHCLGVVAQTGFNCKKNKRPFDPVLTTEIFLRSKPEYWNNPGDLFFICTNKNFWAFERIESNSVAVLKRVTNLDNPSQVLYIGETFDSQKVVITNLEDNAIKPIKVD